MPRESEYPFSGTVPRDVEPSRNVTLPVAVPPYGGCTVAVSSTAWPNEDGFCPEATAVVVFALQTFAVTCEDVAGWKFASPL